MYGIVLEVQLAENSRKRFVWPAYVVNLRARLECPVALLVITADDSVAHWVARTICLGGLHYFSDFAEHYIAVGRAEGKAEGEAHGRAALVLRQLMTRFGLIEGGVIERVQHSSIDELDAIGERLRTAGSLEDALGSW